MTDDLDTRARAARAALDHALDPAAPAFDRLVGRRRRRRHVVTVVASVLIVGAVAAGLVIGTGGRDNQNTLSTTGQAVWTHQTVRTAMGADQRAPIATDDDTAVLVSVAANGTVTSYVASGNGRFEAGVPLRTGTRGLGVTAGALVHHAGTWFAVLQGSLGEKKVHNTSMVLRSEDGLSWKVVDPDGLGGFHVQAMVSNGDHLVAVGTSQHPAGSPHPNPSPMAASSVDGRTWHTTDLPTPDGAKGTTVDATRVGSRLLAVGSAGGDAVAWRSDDGGKTWRSDHLDGFSGDGNTASIAATGDTVVVSASGLAQGQSVSIRSTDGGNTWQTSGDSASGHDGSLGFEVGPVVAGGGRFYRTRKNETAMTDPSRCYAERSLCTDSSVRLTTSTDGEHWQLVDRSSAKGTGADDADTVAVTGSGRVSTFAFTGDGFAVWSWPADTQVAIRSTTTSPKPTAEVLDWRTKPEPGTRYAKPVYLHCTAEYTTIGGRGWKLVDDDTPLARVTYGNEKMSEDWPVAGMNLLGYIELTAPDEIAYSLKDGTVIGHYRPYQGRIPGCM